MAAGLSVRNILSGFMTFLLFSGHVVQDSDEWVGYFSAPSFNVLPLQHPGSTRRSRAGCSHSSHVCGWRGAYTHAYTTNQLHPWTCA